MLGVNVMITICCNFCEISTKKLRFLLNTDDMIIFLPKRLKFDAKSAFFSENILKIITLAPDLSDGVQKILSLQREHSETHS
jgi:hypothetical protein